MEKKNRILEQEMILAVASLFNGKAEEQICKEFDITPATFSKWLKKYGEIGFQYNKLMNENEWLRRKFIDLSLSNQVLNDTINELNK